MYSFEQHTTRFAFVRRSALRLTLVFVTIAALMGIYSSTAAANAPTTKSVKAEIKLTENTTVCVYTKLAPACVQLDVGAVITVQVDYSATVQGAAYIVQEKCDLGLCVFVKLDADVAARIRVSASTGCDCPTIQLLDESVAVAAHERKLLCLSLNT